MQVVHYLRTHGKKLRGLITREEKIIKGLRELRTSLIPPRSSPARSTCETPPHPAGTPSGSPHDRIQDPAIQRLGPARRRRCAPPPGRRGMPRRCHGWDGLALGGGRGGRPDRGRGMTGRFDRFRTHRQSRRWAGHDYASAGWYFVTVCTQHRRPLFGGIRGGVMGLNAAGCIAHACCVSPSPTTRRASAWTRSS